MNHTTTMTFIFALPVLLAIACQTLAQSSPADETGDLGEAVIERPAWQLLRYEEDWSSLRDAPRDSLPWQDAIKHVPLSEDGEVWLSLGGHTRARYESFENFAFGAPRNDNDDFLLWRAKLHADLHVGEFFRVFVEGKSALAADRDLPGGKRTLDADSLALQQAFADLTFRLSERATLTIRPGRQELKFGKQRLVSPLPWGNALRHWDGVSALFTADNFRAHAFWTQFTPVRKYDFNTADTGRDFYGLYTTTDLSATKLDLYYLGFENSGAAFNGSAGNEERHTVGGRVFGAFGDSGIDYDLEGAYQFGRVGSADVSAFMIGSQVGWSLSDTPGNPRVFVGFDYGSGDDRAGGDVQTFNHLYPLGHAYLGYIDIVGRQNILDVSAGVRFSPLDRVVVGIDGHLFYRADEDDALYNAGGGAVRAGGGSSSTEVGAEIDLTVKWSVNRHVKAEVGYSHFFAGDFIEDTGASQDIAFFYSQVTFTF